MEKSVLLIIIKYSHQFKNMKCENVHFAKFALVSAYLSEYRRSAVYKICKAICLLWKGMTP